MNRSTTTLHVRLLSPLAMSLPLLLLSLCSVLAAERNTINNYNESKDTDNQPSPTSICVKPAATSGNQLQYKRYVSKDCKYCLEYPSDLFVERHNGSDYASKYTDARSLKLIGKMKDVSLYADVLSAIDEENGHNISLEELYKDESAVSSDGKLLRKEKGKDWYTVRRVSKSNVMMYQKLILGKTKRQQLFFKSFQLTYPLAKQEEFEPIIQHMAASFRNLP